MGSQFLAAAIFAFGLSSIPSAEARIYPDASKAFFDTCKTMPNADCEITIFRELSKTYRPSRDEGELREYILAVKQMAESAYWNNQALETFQDPIGNLMIRLPATGEFTKRTEQKYFALQSHMDMVLAYADAQPGEDIRPYFRNGIQIEEKDGWLQSKDNKTTLGADNGIGVAFAIRYLVDPTLPHPPLELIFTVQEETGLTGAFQSELPILSRKMLCLDGMTPEPGFIIAGAQGGNTNKIDLNAKNSVAIDSRNSTIVQISVKKLAGGHSGGDIHRGRVNAMRAFAQMLIFLDEGRSAIRLKNLLVGDIGVYNKIPNLFKAEIVVPNSLLTLGWQERLGQFMQNIFLATAEDSLHATLEIQERAETDPMATSADEVFTSHLADTILNAPYAVIDTDPMFLYGVMTSNNLSYIQFGTKPEAPTLLEFGHMARGFDNQKIQAVADRVVGAFLANQNLYSNFAVKNLARYSPWLEPDSSTLLQETLTSSGYFTQKFYINGGLEPSAFKEKYPDLEVVALGPLTRDAHSVTERLNLESIPRTIAGIRNIVQAQK